MIQKQMFLIFAALLICSCGSKTAGPGDDFTENYKNGKLYKDCKALQQIDSGRFLYHCTTFYESGIKRTEGDYINGVTPIGWLSYYRFKGSLKKREEWWRKDKTHIALNQVISYDKDGNIEKKESNYYIIRNLDSALTDKPARVEFTLAAPYYPKSRIALFVKSNVDTVEQVYTQSEYSIVKTFEKPANGKLRVYGHLMELMEMDRKGDTTRMQQRVLFFDKEF